MSIRRPAMPRELSQPQAVRALVMFLYATAMWALPAFAIGTVLLADFSWPIKACAVLMLAVVGGNGILLAGFVGHDGVHFNLHPNKKVSVWLGLLATAPLVVIVEMGFALSHWRHHKNVGEKGLDPDQDIFGKFNSFFSRALLARPLACNVYAKNAVLYIFGKGPKFSFPLPDSTLRGFCAANLALCGVFLGVHVLIFLTAPMYEIGFLITLAAGSVISGLSPYIEHAGTPGDAGYETRSCEGLWWDVFLYGNNYHIEHHLYPNIPAYNLGKAHRIMKEAGYYDERRPLTRGALNTYRFTLGKYPY